MTAAEALKWADMSDHMDDTSAKAMVALAAEVRRLHECEASAAAMKYALTQEIDGLPPTDYIAINFPATRGSAPLQKFCQTLRDGAGKFAGRGLVDEVVKLRAECLRLDTNAIATNAGRELLAEVERLREDNAYLNNQRDELWREISKAKHGDSGYAVITEERDALRRKVEAAKGMADAINKQIHWRPNPMLKAAFNEWQEANK